MALVAVSESFLSANWHRVAGLRPRLRPHVQMHRHRTRGTSWYVVQDDLSGRQHRFSAATYLFVGLLDGAHSVDEVWREIVERLADAAPSQDAAIQALARLHAADLLQTDVPPSTVELLERHDRLARAELRRRFGNPLSIKLPLFDPDGLLERTMHLVRPLFGLPGGLIWLAIVLPALLLAAMHWRALSLDFTDRVLAGESLVAIAAVYPLTKLLHEAGHGYAVKRWGGAVHELGVMLLVLFPLPYVDASAASAFRGKWSRVTVGAAGMLTEIFLAGLAMLVWLNVEPGAVRSLAYAVMVTAGVGTVLFNANPLMRLDGYYILGDLIDIPNLAARSAQFWRRLAERHLFGLRRRQPPVATGTERAWCLLYLPLSFAYRLSVMFGVGVFVARRFFYVGVAIALWGAATTLLMPLLKGIWHLLTAPELDGARARACAGVAALALAASGVLFVLPLPRHSAAEGVVWLPESSIVRASADGVVAALAARPGTQAAPGQAVVILDDPELARSVPLLQAQVAGAEARLDARRFGDQVQAGLIRQELRFRQADLAGARERLSRLVVRAGAAGVLVVPQAEDLPGRFVRRGDVLGFVTPNGSRIVRVAVGQDDVDLVRHHLLGAALLIPGEAMDIRAARLVREVPGGADRLPSSALGNGGGGELATDPRDQSRTLTLRRTFQFDLELDAADGSLAEYGERLPVRFDHGTAPLGVLLYRRLRQLVLARFDA